jgi:hypothetical protein
MFVLSIPIGPQTYNGSMVPHMTDCEYPGLFEPPFSAPLGGWVCVRDGVSVVACVKWATPFDCPKQKPNHALA